MKKYIILIVVLFTQCQVINYDNLKNYEKTTISGVARDAKASAVIVTKEDSIYYIDGLDYWGKKYLNKVIVVEGYMVNINNSRSTDSVIHSQSVEFQRVIMKPKYKILK